MTTKIMTSVPLAGALLNRLTGASNGIGVLTFARFYTLHTILLPAGTMLLVSIHLYLVRRHGVTAGAVNSEKKQKFYPAQMFRDAVSIFIAFALLFAAAAFIQVPLERMADPTDISYVPRPEWYFLFLFQLLKLFKGSLEPVGTVVLPTLAVLILFLLPFMRGFLLRLLDRRAAGAWTVFGVFSVWAGLTAAALLSTPAHKSSISIPPEAEEWARFSPEEIAGMGYFRSSQCDSCHNLLTGNPKPGPNLASANLHHPKEWLAQHFTHPGSAAPGYNAPTESLSIPQLNALSLFVASLKPDSVAVLQTMSAHFIEGAQVYVGGACTSCHKVNGIGGGIGPPLNGLSGRRTRQWVQEHFASPQRLSPGSIMPAYRFTPVEENAILLYLFSLPD